MTNSKPYLIQLKKFSDKGGELSFIEDELPFAINRLYWIYNTSSEVQRGGHAHAVTDRVLICLHKSVKIKLQGQNKTVYEFELNQPNTALYFPKMYWVHMTFEEGAILLAGASTSYNDDIYIKSYEEFLNN